MNENSKAVTVFFKGSAFFYLVVFLCINTIYDNAYTWAQMSQFPHDGIIITNIHTAPSPALANNGTFRINVTVINNSSNTIQFTEICRPSILVNFDINARVVADSRLQFCNTIHIRELKSGEMTSLVSTAFRALAAGIVNSEITFYYRTIHNGKNVTSNDNMPLTAGPIPFRFTIR